MKTPRKIGMDRQARNWHKAPETYKGVRIMGLIGHRFYMNNFPALAAQPRTRRMPLSFVKDFLGPNEKRLHNIHKTQDNILAPLCQFVVQRVVLCNSHRKYSPYMCRLRCSQSFSQFFIVGLTKQTACSRRDVYSSEHRS